MAWSEIDMAKAEWTIPGQRTKNGRSHTVPLAPQALALLGEVKRVGPLVFQNAKETVPSGFGKVAAKLLQASQAAAKAQTAEAGPEHWVLHDIRRTVATGLQRLGV